MEEKKYVEVDLGGMFRKLIKEKRTILKWCGVAFLVGVVIAISVPKSYKAIAKMAPESGDKTGSSALSSLASRAGINLGTTGTTDSVSPELYPDVVTSSPFVAELFSVPVTFERHREKITVDYYTYLDKYYKRAWWEKLLGLPGTVMGWVMDLLTPRKDKTGEAEVSGPGPIDPNNLTMPQIAIAEMVRKDVSLGVDKKTSVIYLTVKAQQPEVAQMLCERVIQQLQIYVADYRTKKARQDLEYFEQLYEEARSDYYAAQQRLAAHMDRNQSIIMQRGKTEQERLQNEMTLKYQLYNSCAQQVQTAKAKILLDTPAFSIIEPPQTPIIGKPSRPIVLFIVVFLGFLLSILWILWGRDAIASLRRDDKEEPAADTDPAPAPEKEDSQA